jgi:oligoendopeptidase F
MYYIEYGIAQLGALQLWQSSKVRGEKAAVDAYIRALTLGGSRPLPELFKAADLSFDFGDATVARVVEAVEGELAK